MKYLRVFEFEFAKTISRVPRLVMAASSILCLGCGRDITETPQKRRGLGVGSSNIVDGYGWDHRKKALQRMSMLLVDSLQLNFNNFEKQRKKDQGKVQLYANKLLSLGCFYLEYSDAIREGDGLRVVRCWRYICFQCL